MNPSGRLPVSVVVIARDEGHRIGDCLKSIMGALPAEIIVVVDARSTDETAALAGIHGATVTVSQGYRGRLRNVGWQQAKSDYVCFVDADHILPPDYLATTLNEMCKCATAGMVGAPLQPFGNSVWEVQAAIIWNFRGAMGTGGSLYRKLALTELGGFHDDLHCGEDGELSTRLTQRGWKRILCQSTFSYHEFPKSYAATIHKLKYGAAGGVKPRSLLRILLSFPAAFVIAVRYRSIHALWYCPWRAIYLAFFGGHNPQEYHPLKYH